MDIIAKHHALPFIEAILRERDRQDQKFGEQRHTDGKWLLILQEELGEAAKALLDNTVDADIELVEAAAVIVAWLEARARRTTVKALEQQAGYVIPT